MPMISAMQPLASAAAITSSVQDAAMTPFEASHVRRSLRRTMPLNSAMARAWSFSRSSSSHITCSTPQSSSSRCSSSSTDATERRRTPLPLNVRTLQNVQRARQPRPASEVAKRASRALK